MKSPPVPADTRCNTPRPRKPPLARPAACHARWFTTPVTASQRPSGDQAGVWATTNRSHRECPGVGAVFLHDMEARRQLPYRRSRLNGDVRDASAVGRPRRKDLEGWADGEPSVIGAIETSHYQILLVLPVSRPRPLQLSPNLTGGIDEALAIRETLKAVSPLSIRGGRCLVPGSVMCRRWLPSGTTAYSPASWLKTTTAPLALH